MTELRYKRILVKLSGEALMGQFEFGIDPEMVLKVSRDLIDLQQSGIELGVVVGGGNIFRGAGLAKAGVDRVTGDHMGMLATVMNALALRDSLQQQGVEASVMSGLDMPQVCERYTQRDARRRIAAGDIVIFAAGTGSPYFTTDTAACLRAIEIQANLIVKATKVDGIYDKDPVKFADAVKYDALDFDQAIDQRLAVMDVTAMVLCNENNLDLVVCNINESGVISGLSRGKKAGTLVTPNR